MPAGIGHELKKNQGNLFSETNDLWRDEWGGMPEYENDYQLPRYTIKVNLRSVEDLQRFAELIGQPLLPTTRYVWYPEAEKDSVKDLAYVDES